MFIYKCDVVQVLVKTVGSRIKTSFINKTKTDYYSAQRWDLPVFCLVDSIQGPLIYSESTGRKMKKDSCVRGVDSFLNTGGLAVV